jgi:hypothetical protein
VNELVDQRHSVFQSTWPNSKSEFDLTRARVYASSFRGIRAFINRLSLLLVPAPKLAPLLRH